MASLIWTTVFLFLLFELVLTFVLVVPVPRKIRNFIAREIFQFNVGERLKKPVLFIGLALLFALIESYVTHQRIIEREEDEREAGIMVGRDHHDRMFHLHDRERKYKAERNMYLSGFALTLIFVIGRITQLMQESVELEEETERIKKFQLASNEAEAKQKDPADKKTD